MTENPKYQLITKEFNGTELISAYTLDGHYIGTEEWAIKLTEELGVVPEINKPEHSVCSIGFCEKLQTWYGWSHRAIFGFTVGSVVKEGDCAYRAPDKESFKKQCLDFWKDEFYENMEADENSEGTGVIVTWVYKDTVPNKKIRGTRGGHFTEYPEEMGRGEWTALTLEDAKQMAKDFAEAVS